MGKMGFDWCERALADPMYEWDESTNRRETMATDDTLHGLDGHYTVNIDPAPEPDPLVEKLRTQLNYELAVFVALGDAVYDTKGKQSAIIERLANAIKALSNA